ncbi:MAG: prepilin-type N-terminal cleavage/methylation domain-containing protein [Verrucomicrobiota bacterium]
MFASSHHRHDAIGQLPRCGLTLIELIISMSILAIIASIALVSVTEMGELDRFDETHRRGSIAQRAVLGEPGEVSRFFSDMGRYPLVLVDTNDAGLNDDQKSELQGWLLAELYDINLWSNDSGSTQQVYTPAQATAVAYEKCQIQVDYTFTGEINSPSAIYADGDLVQLGAGWRGPYMLSSFDAFTDNWGQVWEVTSDDDYALAASGWTDEPTQDAEIRGVRSSWYLSEDSANNTNDTEEVTWGLNKSLCYADLQVNLFDGSNAPLTTGTVAGEVNRVRVILYLPYCEPAVQPQLCEVAAWWNDGSTPDTRYRITTDNTTGDADDTEEASLPPLIETRTNTIAVNSVSFDNVPVGTRKIWAYATNTTGSTKILCRLQTIEVRPGSNVVNLYLNETY